MNRQIPLTWILSLAFLLSPMTSATQLREPVVVADADIALPEEANGIPGAGTNWWAAAQEDIRQGEYKVTWQRSTYLEDLSAAYQAPNRAHNLRTYFAPDGIRVIPRVFEGEKPPWEWGLTLTGYGTLGNVQPVSAASLTVEEDRIEYRRAGLTEWYINDERGLEQGFTLDSATESTVTDEQATIVLIMVIGGNLASSLAGGASSVEVATPRGDHVLRYGGLTVTDATGRPLLARFGLSFPQDGQSPELSITVEAAGAVYPITVDPTITGLATSPAWTAESDRAGANFGFSVGAAGDVNGDGYSDVIVGAWMYDNGQDEEGRAYLYHGEADGPSTTASWVVESDQQGARMGNSVGTAGDVNGDGYSDVIVGAHDYDDDGSDAVGRIYAYYGGPGGLSTTADWIVQGDQGSSYFGNSVGTAGDVNGDGYSDVIAGAHYYNSGLGWGQGRATVYYGSASGLNPTANWTVVSDQSPGYFGWAVGTAGDVNGDGYSEVIVAAYGYTNGQTNEGRVFVYHGSATGLSTAADWWAESDQDSAWFGTSVRTAGDVNGDGYSDVMVGAPLYDNGETDEGRAYVYHGSASGLSASATWTAEGDQNDASFGRSVGTAGDVNGDGYSDVIVGASSFTNGQMDEGRAYVYHGGATGLSTSPAWTAESDQDSAWFGYSVGTAGDVNGDGYSDVIVGAIGYDNGQADEGGAFVYHGAASGLSATAAWTAESDQDEADFGHSVGTAGDINGDGYSDVIVGAPWYDNGQSGEGRAFVYHGAAGGLAAAHTWSAEGNQDGAILGISVGTTGDVNGDGYSDVIVGAYGYSNGQTDEGMAYVYHGSAAGLAASPAWTAESDQDGAQFGSSVATAGDVNGDGYSDVIIGAWHYDNGQDEEGRAYVHHGSAGGLAAAPAWMAESDQVGAWFGQSVGTAGDVNGDGYSDVIVGAPYYDNGQDREGRAYVYHGVAGGLAASPNWSAESDQDGAQFGRSVGTAGDVNGDGYSDVIVGAPSYDNDQANEGRAFVYYGNGGDGLHLLPRQLRSDGSAPIALLGMSDSRTAFQLHLIGRMPLGREDVRLEWQVAPLGVPFAEPGATGGVSDWTDVLTTGVDISQDVSGLTPGTPYHWRVRLLYRPGNALGQPAGRWLSIPWSGWNETDLRTLPNQPPLADAGLDETVNTLALVTLDGSLSSDPEADLPLIYLWTQTSGPVVTLSDPTAVNPMFTAPNIQSVLTFTLAVTDSLGLPAIVTDEVVITVEPYRVYLPLIARY